MKALRASKKLIVAVVSFVLSIVLCVGVCLAWFAVNKKVTSDMSGVGIQNSDIVRFEVIAHYLNGVKGGFEQAATGNAFGAENVDKNSDGDLDAQDSMRPYGGIGNTFATAILFEINYELLPSDKHYRIFASCPTDSELAVEATDETNEEFTSGLSNAVGYYGVQVNGGVYSKADENAGTFVGSDNTKSFTVGLKDNIVPAVRDGATGNYTACEYVIMDYMPANFIYLSSLMIRGGGTLTSGLSLLGDLTISIESYDPENPDPPEVPDNPDPVDPDPPKPSGETNLFGNLTGKVSAGKIIDNEELSVTLVGSVDVTTTSATSSDGKTFESYLLPGGGNRTYTFTAKQDINLKIYYTVRDGSSVKNSTVSATVDGTVIKTSDDGTRNAGTAYVMEISLTAGQSCVVSSDGNRLVLYGAYIV